MKILYIEWLDSFFFNLIYTKLLILYIYVILYLLYFQSLFKIILKSSLTQYVFLKGPLLLYIPFISNIKLKILINEAIFIDYISHLPFHIINFSSFYGQSNFLYTLFKKEKFYIFYGQTTSPMDWITQAQIIFCHNF